MSFHFKSSPRGRPTDESIASLRVFGPNEKTGQPGFNQKLANVLTEQILERRFDVGEIKRAAPNAKHYLFDEVPCDYGPRMGNQLEAAVEQLEADRDSRRAIIVMGRPDDKVPCCIQTVQFLIRNEELITVVCMRSWDLGLGLAYDLDTFKRLGRYVAEQLQVEQGKIAVFAGSGHVYRE